MSSMKMLSLGRRPLPTLLPSEHKQQRQLTYHTTLPPNKSTGPSARLIHTHAHTHTQRHTHTPQHNHTPHTETQTQTHTLSHPPHPCPISPTLIYLINTHIHLNISLVTTKSQQTLKN